MLRQVAAAREELNKEMKAKALQMQTETDRSKHLMRQIRV